MRIDDMVPGHTSTCTVVDVGVDWLTLVSNRDAEHHDLTLNAWYEAFHLQKHRTGLIEDAHLLGYSGIKTEGFFMGTRYDGAMARVSGTLAKEVFLSLPTAGATATRLDLQVTVKWTGTGVHPCRLAAIHAAAQNELLPSSRQRNIQETHDNDGGYTTYIGSRQSTSFSRIYHKSAQDPDAYGKDAYRYEVQFNKDTAGNVIDALKTHQEHLESAIIAIVWDWHERRGIIPVFKRSAERVIVEREVLPLTELDKKLAWLYNQVRPTVGTLMEAGFREEALVALLGRTTGKEVMDILIRRASAVYDAQSTPRDADQMETYDESL